MTPGLIDPLKLQRLLWPDVTFYREQRRIIYSVRENDVTYVPAGNMLGKDYVAGFIAVEEYLTHEVARIVTTSVKDDHLRVLWGEIGRFINTARHPLTTDKGGPLSVKFRDVRKFSRGVEDPVSYLLGMVSLKGEGMAGHHAPYTLFIIDEASGVDDLVFDQGRTWAKHVLVIGNTNPCTNFFFRGVKAGPRKAEENNHLYSEVIRIKAEDSPNVRLGMAQKMRGEQVTDEEVIPGVIGYREYLNRRATWDLSRQKIGLDAIFPEDETVLMFPPEWLDLAEQRASQLMKDGGYSTKALGIGIDTAQGGDNTAMAAVNRQMLLGLQGKKTPDTNIIIGDSLAFMKLHGCPADKVMFDRGGGGKQHADRLRAMGYAVHTVGFGESVTPEKRHGVSTLGQRKEADEERYQYLNRRAEMYGILRQVLDPNGPTQLALPNALLNRRRLDGRASLREQLVPIPLRYNEEGRMYLLPKNSKPSPSGKETDSLTKLIGCSPDEADALAMAVYVMLRRPTRTTAGVM